jgi:hypothetical protein
MLNLSPVRFSTIKYLPLMEIGGAHCAALSMPTMERKKFLFKH